MRRITPHYRTIEAAGPDHAKLFTVAVFIGPEEVGRGTGHSKQIAAQAAAANALNQLVVEV